MRWAIAASLIVSLSLTELAPQMMVRADDGPVVAPTSPATKCCCGTADGRCCGMGCCVVRQAPSHQQPPVPNQRDDRDGRTNPFGLAFTNSLILFANSRDGLQLRRLISDVARSLAESSLQAEHIRINA